MIIKMQLISLMLLLCNVLSAQSNLSVGLHAEPVVTILEITESEILPPLSEKTVTRAGAGFGAHLQYDIGDNLFIRGGIRFQKLHHRHTIDGYAVPGPGGLPGFASIQNDISIRSFSAPLDFGFRFPSKNENSFVLGLSALLHLDSESSSKTVFIDTYSPPEDIDTEADQVAEAAYSIGVFAGYELGLADKLVIALEPNFRLSPHDFSLHESNAQARVYELGLTIRVRAGIGNGDRR